MVTRLLYLSTELHLHVLRPMIISQASKSISNFSKESSLKTPIYICLLQMFPLCFSTPSLAQMLFLTCCLACSNPCPSNMPIHTIIQPPSRRSEIRNPRAFYYLADSRKHMVIILYKTNTLRDKARGLSVRYLIFFYQSTCLLLSALIPCKTRHMGSLLRLIF